MPTDQAFSVVLRGYDEGEVDALVQRAGRAIASNDPILRSAMREELVTANLRTVFRGYDRSEVNDYIRMAATTLT